MEPVPELVTLHVWRVPRAKVPAALARMSVDRGRARRTRGVRFAKMLGTGRGFALHESDVTRWAKLSTWSHPGNDPVAASWARLADETLRIDLRPLASTGRWSGRTPFGNPDPRRYDGPLAALTRARLVPTRAVAFWRAVPPVHADLLRSPGLRASLAVGEVPVGLQGTFSLWESPRALRAFAYEGAAHRKAIAETTRVGWYAEELFARFEVLALEGTLDGKALL
ncbi:MAG: putative spheroidene monooxygenase [Frankiales bacterium]|nr:putative spheroidene monooxygenase [Frankiales bacterium]